MLPIRRYERVPPTFFFSLGVTRIRYQCFSPIPLYIPGRRVVLRAASGLPPQPRLPGGDAVRELFLFHWFPIGHYPFPQRHQAPKG